MTSAVMPASRVLDYLVATEVMGWVLAIDPLTYQSFYVPADVQDPEDYAPAYYENEWKPSTDIACTWVAVDKYPDYPFVIGRAVNLEGIPVGWFCQIFDSRVEATTAALAICLTLLQVKNVVKVT